MTQFLHFARLVSNQSSRRLLGLYALQKSLSPVDCLLSMGLSAIKRSTLCREVFHPPVFIIGAPRSGATLLYQYLSVVLQVTYISNAWAMLPRSGAYLFPGRTLPPADFRSFYGNSAHIYGPHEGGPIFAQWFHEGEHHFTAELPDELRQKMRTYFEVVSTVGKQPWLIKNGRNALRLQVLKDVLPEAVYIRLHRDLLLVAQSIIEGRLKLRGDPKKSWTVKPREWNIIEPLPYPRQVARQVLHIEAQIEQDLLGIPPENVLTCDYDNFCKAPFEFARKVCEQIPFIRQRANMSSELREMTFRVSSNLRLELDILNQIADELGELTPTRQVVD